VLAQIYQAVSSTPAQVGELRAVLEAQLDGIGVKEAARALGLSDRTLQRRLREAGTSFQDELNGARIRAAQRLLLDSDMPITQIALEVGCASPQHFSTLFRRLAGASPSAWRDENR
jgi:AraC-like DNA-binding protein